MKEDELKIIIIKIINSMSDYNKLVNLYIFVKNMK